MTLSKSSLSVCVEKEGPGTPNLLDTILLAMADEAAIGALTDGSQHEMICQRLKALLQGTTLDSNLRQEADALLSLLSLTPLQGLVDATCVQAKNLLAVMLYVHGSIPQVAELVA